MEATLDQIRATFDCGIWYPVVSAVLMMPDACGAVEFQGQDIRPKARYINWYDKWVLPLFPSDKFTGSTVYIVRNAMLHESTGFTRGQHGFDRVIFMPPDPRGNVMERSTLGGVVGTTEEIAFTVTVRGFMEAMDQGVRNWLVEVRSDSDARRRNAIDKIVQYRPHGRDPFIIGLPVIC